MSKLAPSSTKYIIRASIKAKGVVEKPDVIGAIFGQTEGLLGSDLNLRELQRTGKIGRIEVNVKSIKGNSEGEIIIPTSLSSAETSLIAATLETIERVGPCTATIKLLKVDDAMENKRKFVVDKAKQILQGLVETSTLDVDEISEQIKESVRTHEITSYQGLPAGPGIAESDNILIVEGRADVLNLLKFGIKNAIAIEGTSVPLQIVALAKEKETTALTDGDRGGILIIKELMQVAEIDFVSQAPAGKEVEECTKKEVYKAIRDRIPAEQFRGELLNLPDKKPKVEQQQTYFKAPEHQPKFEQPVAITTSSGKFEKRPVYSEKPIRGRPTTRSPPTPRRSNLKPDQRDLFKKTLDELVGTRAACIFNDKNELLGKVPVSELENVVRTIDDPYCIVFDGKVDFKMDFIAKKKNTIKYLIGMEKDRILSPINILSREDLEA